MPFCVSRPTESDTDQLKMASSGSAEEGTIEEASEEVIEQDEIEAEVNTDTAN